jgi:hypothetical protein
VRLRNYCIIPLMRCKCKIAFSRQGVIPDVTEPRTRGIMRRVSRIAWERQNEADETARIARHAALYLRH